MRNVFSCFFLFILCVYGHFSSESGNLFFENCLSTAFNSPEVDNQIESCVNLQEKLINSKIKMKNHEKLCVIYNQDKSCKIVKKKFSIDQFIVKIILPECGKENGDQQNCDQLISSLGSYTEFMEIAKNLKGYKINDTLLDCERRTKNKKICSYLE